jgi:sulfide:quinone oxidoreductase
MKKVIILGGGFAGVQAAIELSKKKIFDVTLISNRDYFFLYPISIWIPTKSIPFEKVKISLSDIAQAHGFNFFVDEFSAVISKQNKIELKSQTVEYDYLIVAIGADKVQHIGIENTLSICGKPETSLEIQKRIEELVEQNKGTIALGFGGNPKDKSAVRGGPAFELAFNLDHYLKQKKIRDKFNLIFFAPMEEPGARMGLKAMQMANKMLDSFGIKRYFGKKIKKFDSDGIVFEDDSKIQSDLTLFIPASAGNKTLQNSDLPLTEAGFVKIDDNCLVENTKNVFAVGDVAALNGPEWKAKQGHMAEVMARAAVNNIYAIETNNSHRNGYQKHLNILCIMDTGNGAAFVFRNDKRAFAIPLPVIGHTIKKMWGKYVILTKLGKIPRLPGL